MIFKILFALIITIFFTSCSDNTTEDPPLQNITSENNNSLFPLDTDNDMLADQYESLFNLVVGEKDADLLYLDPLYELQWHLYNRSYAGEDIHVVDAWRESIGEKNITVAIVDSGIDILHPDLDVDTNKSYRYSDASHDPSPTPSQLSQNSSGSAHGTACAGLVAAKGWNGIGVRGVAPNITLVGLNVFSNATDATFIDALLKDGVDVSSNSWGGGGAHNLFDDKTSLDAIESGVEKREGKGIVYVFAAGNDAANANFQSILSSGYVIAVSAVDEQGVIEAYSDFGANILIAAPGGAQYAESAPAIITTDISGLQEGMDVYRNSWAVDGNEEGDYTNTMNGTSAACPIISGVVALMLSVNHNLSYKEVQYILAMSARKNDVNDDAWDTNAEGISFNPKYGFGVVDATKALSFSKSFKSLGEEKNITKIFKVEESIASQKEIVLEINVEEDFSIQTAQIEIRTDHDNTGKLKLTLESPSGTHSILTYGDTVLYDNFDPWTLLSYKFLNEHTVGHWKLYIEDKGFGNSVTFLEASLILKGFKK